MHWNILVPIVAMGAWPVAWSFTTWVRARHGYPLDGDDGEAVHPNGPMAKLTAENERQARQIVELRDRLHVLERIATDPATRVAGQIDALR